MGKYKLTDEHRKQLKPWADKWIKNSMSTEPCTPYLEEIRDNVEGLYRSAGLTPPPRHRIILVPSPFIARFAGGFASWIWYLRKNKKSYAATRAATQIGRASCRERV